MGFGDSVWERARNQRVTETLGRRGYIAATTMFTVYGLVISTLVALSTLEWNPSLWGFLGFGLGIPLVGIVLAMFSDNPIVSFIGYTLVTCGLGAIVGPAVAQYSLGVVLIALQATLGVTLVISIVGIVYPKSLEHWGSYLFGALVALLFARIAQIFLASFGVSSGEGWWMILEYGGAVLFSLYIIYDWNRAIRLPHTWDNAIDCALAIYLDIINLFLHLLRILGNSSND